MLYSLIQILSTSYNTWSCKKLLSFPAYVICAGCSQSIFSQRTLSLITYLSFYVTLCFVIIDDNKVAICYLILNASYMHGGSFHSLSSRNFSLSFVFSARDLGVFSCPSSQLKPYAKRPLNFPEDGSWNIRLASVCHLYCFSCFHNLPFSQWQMHTSIVADRIAIFLLGFDTALCPAAVGYTKGMQLVHPKVWTSPVILWSVLA